MKKTSSRLLAVFLTALYLISTAGCKLAEQPVDNTVIAGQKTENPDSLTVELTVLAEELKEKYADQVNYEYTQPVRSLKADARFEFKSDFGPKSLGIEAEENTLRLKDGEYTTKGIFSGEALYNVLNVFIDSKLTISAKPEIIYSEDKGTYLVGPPRRAPLAPLTLNNMYYASSPWGLACQYYLVFYYDLDTGKKLDKPRITVFDVERGGDSPFLEFKKSDTGFASFKWSESDGAEKYHLCAVGKYGSTTLRENIKGNSVVHHSIDYIADYEFINYVFRKSSSFYDYIYVVAEKDGVLSAASNLISVDSFRNALVSEFDLENEKMKLRVNDPSELAAFLPVKMCDDSTVMYPVTYGIDEIKLQSLMDIYGHQIEDIDMSQVFTAIPVTADGTEVKTVMLFDKEKYDDPEFRRELADAIQRLEASKGKAGADDSIKITREKKDSIATSVNSIDIADEFPVFASCALSEYLAVNMLSGNENIEISMFNEANDTDYLLSSFYEAYYQNPLILKVTGMSLSHGGSTLHVEYGQSREEQSEKQKEIKQAVAKIIDDIISSSMTDLEKEIAINNYLCTSAKYDTAALENAMASGKAADNKFRDSFTPYGILVKKTGVCSGYAGAFKLLADASGLKSIVVTGYLNGNLSHAWNRVLIGRDWLTIDVTNNANPEMVNALLNLWDEVSAPVLVEDNHYVLGSALYKYTAKNNELEYYRYTGRYYSLNEIADKLAEGLEKDGVVTLRTSESLTSEELKSILAEVAKNPRFAGRKNVLENIWHYDYLGCITLKYNKK